MRGKLTKDERQILGFQFQDFIKIFGWETPSQEKTPERMLKMYEELLIAKEPDITVFDSQGYDEMIIDKGIPFYSLCEHHILPFYGTVTIGYIPDKKIIGLSKLARITDYFSRTLNTQEYFTQNVANYINHKLKPKGVGVIVRAVHLCKMMRGIRSQGEMITSKLSGVFLQRPEVRQEFMKL